MITINRIYEFMQTLNISMREFERLSGTKNGYFAKMKSTNGSIGSEILSKMVIAFPDLNATWLLTGKGEMLKKENLTTLEAKSEIKTVDNIDLSSTREKYLKEIERLNNIIDNQAELLAIKKAELAKFQNIKKYAKKPVTG